MKLRLPFNDRRVLVLLGLGGLLWLIANSQAVVSTLGSTYSTRFGYGPAIPQFAGLRMAIVEQTWYHDEVIGAVLKVVKDLGINPAFYRTQFNAGFEKVIADVWDVEERPPLPPQQLAQDIEAGMFDVLVLVTCDKKFWGYPEIVEAWTARKDLRIICLLHELEYYAKDQLDQRVHLTVPAGEGRLTIGTLTDHGAEAMREALVVYEEEKGEPEWRGVDVFSFAPVFEVASNISLDASRSPVEQTQPITKASILGRIYPYSRDYKRIFAELLEAMTEDPLAWGYSKEPYQHASIPPSPFGASELEAGKTAEAEQGEVPEWVFVPLEDTSAPPPFQLLLVGKDDGAVPIPPQLKLTQAGKEPVVVVEADVAYPEFYKAIATSDVVLPIFWGDLYYIHRASAAIAAAVIAKTPILADDRLKTAYPYAYGPAVIAQEEGQTELQVIAHQRKAASRHVREKQQSPAQSTDSSWKTYLSELKTDNMGEWAGALDRLLAKTISA